VCHTQVTGLVVGIVAALTIILAMPFISCLPGRCRSRTEQEPMGTVRCRTRFGQQSRSYKPHGARSREPGWLVLTCAHKPSWPLHAIHFTSQTLRFLPNPLTCVRVCVIAGDDAKHRYVLGVASRAGRADRRERQRRRRWRLLWVGAGAGAWTWRRRRRTEQPAACDPCWFEHMRVGEY
jgi:hypothetical protein